MRFVLPHSSQDCPARLVLLNAMGAAEKGASILTRSPAIGARRETGGWTVTPRTRATGESRQFRVRRLVNCAGPPGWRCDPTGARSAGKVRLVRSSPVIVPKRWAGSNACLAQKHDKRMIFINPYEGDKAMIGSTDIAYLLAAGLVEPGIAVIVNDGPMAAPLASRWRGCAPIWRSSRRPRSPDAAPFTG